MFPAFIGGVDRRQAAEFGNESPDIDHRDLECLSVAIFGDGANMKLHNMARLLLLMSLSLPAAASDLREVVIGLYKDYAWSAIFGVELSHNMKTVNAEDGKVLSKYFSAELSKAISDDNKCVAKNGEFCKLDYDILFDSQDPVITDLNILGCGSECVKVCFKEIEKKKCITVNGQSNAGATRITDFVYEDGRSLRKSLGLKN